jgi:hypothetical protein
MVYAPAKYFTGLSPSEKKQRLRRIKEGHKTNSSDPRAYRPFKTDKGKKVKKSKYTEKFESLYPDAKSLRNKARVTGVPYSIIKKVYDKGLAAWRTGHRPGASQQAWGYARVHSFLTRGKTFWTVDSHLVREAVPKMKYSDIKKWASI